MPGAHELALDFITLELPNAAVAHLHLSTPQDRTISHQESTETTSLAIQVDELRALQSMSEQQIAQGVLKAKN